MTKCFANYRGKKHMTKKTKNSEEDYRCKSSKLIVTSNVYDPSAPTVKQKNKTQLHVVYKKSTLKTKIC